MKDLFAQIIKFGIVGAICFVIDYLIGIAVMNSILLLTSTSYFQIASVAGAVVGFCVSVVVNYLLSFKFVFNRKEGLDRRREFIIFLTLSLIGLVLNSFVIWLVVGPIYRNTFLNTVLGYNAVYSVGKIISTIIVMVYNFVTRKIFLEEKPGEGRK